MGESTTMRTEPNKSAIDLAVKALREKERQQKYDHTIIVNRLPSSSIVAYKPKEDHKPVRDVFNLVFC